MITIDQLNRSISLPDHPTRIISIVPSQTELLFDIGLDNEVIAITKFCIHPEEWFETKTRIGGTKNLNIEKIKSLNPDLIIANKEENTEAQIQELMKDFPVWVSDIKNLDDALAMIREVSLITGKEKKGKEIVENIIREFNSLKTISGEIISCAYIIWNKPIMTVGGDTFISDLLSQAGYKNIFHDKIRYPEITFDDLINLNPEVILLSSEPFPFKEKNVSDFQKLLPKSMVKLVDGEMFSWYGSRLLKSPAYFLKLREKIHSAL
jgi:ABC-type Fe3+-hydroxamate transport system substrate-binding protein